jgi:enamine deaminase RidA (YjgF/YER057c/UK114 family)
MVLAREVASLLPFPYDNRNEQASTGRRGMPDFVRYTNPTTMEKPPGYSQIVEVRGDARIVFFAGQLGVDISGAFAGAPGDFKAQTVQAFENLKAALEACGAGFGHLIKITNYLVDIEQNMAAFREVRDSYLVRPPPASTTVGVPALARPGGLFEIDAIAALPA